MTSCLLYSNSYNEDVRHLGEKSYCFGYTHCFDACKQNVLDNTAVLHYKSQITFVPAIVVTQLEIESFGCEYLFHCDTLYVKYYCRRWHADRLLKITEL